jgi:DNA-directed RNA polymerase specialized sigma subunit
MIPFTEYFLAPTETACAAFERLMKKYEPTIFKVVNQNILVYSSYLYSTSDHDDLLQIARYAFWEANQKFAIGKVGQEKHPEHVFIAFAVQTMNGRLSDHLRKHYKNLRPESFSSTDSSYNIPDETPEPMKTHMLQLLADRLPRLSPRETRYLNLILFDDWNTR